MNDLGRNYPRTPSRFQREGEPFPRSPWKEEPHIPEMVMAAICIAAVVWLATTILLSLGG